MKISFVLILFRMALSGHKFTYLTTIELSWHVHNCALTKKQKNSAYFHLFINSFFFFTKVGFGGHKSFVILLSKAIFFIRTLFSSQVSSGFKNIFYWTHETRHCFTRHIHLNPLSNNVLTHSLNTPHKKFSSDICKMLTQFWREVDVGHFKSILNNRSIPQIPQCIRQISHNS